MEVRLAVLDNKVVSTIMERRFDCSRRVHDQMRIDWELKGDEPLLERRYMTGATVKLVSTESSTSEDPYFESFDTGKVLVDGLIIYSSYRLIHDCTCSCSLCQLYRSWLWCVLAKRFIWGLKARRPISFCKLCEIFESRPSHVITLFMLTSANLAVNRIQNYPEPPS